MPMKLPSEPKYGSLPLEWFYYGQPPLGNIYRILVFPLRGVLFLKKQALQTL